MGRRVFVERLTDEDARAGNQPTVCQIAGSPKERNERLILPDDQVLRPTEAIRFAKWILRRLDR